MKPKFKVGDKVDYHSIIGGEITSTGHIIEKIQLKPNNFGCDVAWITNKSGCVALAALTLSEEQNPIVKSILGGQPTYWTDNK